MTNLEIHKKIDEINAMVVKLLSPNEFILSNLIVKLTAEVQSLQSQCTHKFVEGFCEYCYKEQDS